MKRNFSIYLLCLSFVILLFPIAYGHEEGAQAISKESLEGPIYAFVIIVLAVIIARYIRKCGVKQKIKEGKKYGKK